MKKISKAQQTEIDDQVGKMIDAGKTLETAVESFNTATAAPRAVVVAALAEYNEELTVLRDLYGQLHNEAGQYQSERSEKWNESDAGQAYAEWVDSFADIENVSDDVYIEIPEEMEKPDLPDWTDPSFLPEPEPNPV